MTRRGVGPGRVGCAIAALLARAGADVLLVGRSRPRIDAIARRGLAIENGGVQDTVVRLPATTDPADSPASI